MKAIVLCAMIAGLGWRAAAAETSEIGTNQTVKHFTFKTTAERQMNYLLFLPQGYTEPKKDWPLILFLHGAGERGTDISKVTTHGPPKRVKTHPEFPFIVVSPQCPEGEIWSRDMLLALLEQVMKTQHVDRSRVYLTGLSMGGYGTWDLGLSHSEKFAAIVPICGGGDYITMLLASREKPEILHTLGIWAFHGAKDPVVPVSESERMVGFARKLGVKEVKLTVYPEAQHDSWSQAYDNPELYEWMLQHRRGAAGSEEK
jgi:predicted peptidase